MILLEVPEVDFNHSYRGSIPRYEGLYPWLQPFDDTSAAPTKRLIPHDVAITMSGPGCLPLLQIAAPRLNPGRNRFET